MINDILKYVFWALVCIPVLVLGIVFFAKLKKVDKDIKQEAIDRKAKKAIEDAQKERERNRYKLASDKIDQKRREERYYN